MAIIQGILARTDRLENMDKRRFQGDFFTPLAFAELGLDYIAKVLGEDWYKTHKVWDMACGTGNLEYHIPTYENVFMSTIDTGEVSYIQSNNMFPGATVFQYDYLNDDVELVMAGADLLNDKLGWKLPRKLREALADKNNKWVVLINPPFATHKTGVGVDSKAGVGQSEIKNQMDSFNQSKGSIELFIQFIYRIKHEIPSAYLALYAPLKYINNFELESFRESFFRASYKRGFIFPSSVFDGSKGKWPVSFILWDLSTEGTMIDVLNKFDVFNEERLHIGDKTITTRPKSESLNKWVTRPKKDTPAAPLSSAIKIKENGAISDSLSKNAIGFLLSNANDPQQACQLTGIFSSVFMNGGAGWSIEDTNFEQSLIVCTMRRLAGHTWLNHNDQFKKSSVYFSEDFVNDCSLWCLFDDTKNQTSSLKDVEYKGTTYQVRNQFYPYPVSELKEWEHPIDLNGQLRNAQDTYVATWLKGRTLSPETQALLDAGRKVYQVFYKEYRNLNHTKFKIDYWDVGWYQIRNALLDAKLGLVELNALKEAHTKLTEKLRPRVYEYGFLDEEIIYGDCLEVLPSIKEYSS